MKGKKILSLLLTTAILAALLAGCGASSNTAAKYEAAAPMEAPMADAEYLTEGSEAIYGTAGSGSGEASATGQKLITRVNIDAETEDLDALLTNLNEQVKELGGYIESQELYNGSYYSSYRSRSASMTIRIPADKLPGFIEEVKGASNVVTYNESQEDVTLTYISVESRISALEVEQDRLLELLAQAENMTDLLEIESRLTDVRYELENTTSQLLVLANQVDYATVNLDIDQVEVYTEVEEPTFWQRIGNGFKENLGDIGEGIADFVVWLIVYSPQLLFWAAVIAVIVWLCRRSARKRREKYAAMAPKYPPQQNNGQQNNGQN